MSETLSDRALKAIQNRPRRKVQAFFICLLVSVFIWFTRELSKDFSTTLSVPIEYIDVPDRLMLYGENPTTLSVSITSAGFDVFGQNVLGRVGSVKVSLAHLQGPGVTSFDEYFLQAQIKSAISSEAELVSFAPKQISLDIARRTIKKIPVNASVSATVEEPYFLLGNPVATPDSVVIEGPAPMLDSLEFVSTTLVEFANVSETQTRNVRLNLPDQVSSDIREVDVEIKLDQWTEKSLDVPVEVVYQNETLMMKTFPHSTRVTCQVGLSEYNSINPDNFSVQVREYSEQELKTGYKVALEIVDQPARTRHVVLDPPGVEFIIVEKN